MSTPESGRASWVTPRLVLSVVLVVLALIFIFQNTATTHVHLFGWTVSMSGWLWLLIVFVAGAVAGSVYPWLRPRSKR